MNSNIFAMGSQGITEAELVAMVVSVTIVTMMIVLAFYAVIYVFQSIGLHTIARRRGIKNPWLAWIPIGSYWIVGSISDDYRFRVRGEVRSRRHLLLALFLAVTLLNLYQEIKAIQFLWKLFAYSESMSLLQLERLLREYESGTMLGALLSLVVSGVSIVALVFYYMSLNDIYASCRPRQKVVFLVLSIIFGLQPFFIFACRKHDEGMQPQQPQLPYWTQQWPPQNPPQWPPQNPGQWPPQNPPQPPRQDPPQWRQPNNETDL